MIKHSARQTVGELFCAPGGLGYGLKQAGFVTLWGVDADASACRTYARNVCEDVVHAAVEETDFTSLARPNGLAFSFPGTESTAVGESRSHDGGDGALCREVARALAEVQPLWFIAGNVPGAIGNGLHEIMQVLADAGPGYRVSVHLYRFEEYGVPQNRHRVVAVGIRRDLGVEFLPPAPTHAEPVTVAAALAGVGEVAENNEPIRHPRRTIEMLGYIPEGQNAWCEELPEEYRIQTGTRISSIYRRLRRDQPAYTVTGGGGGGTLMYHWEEPRGLTNRERARLQAFPDSFVFEGGKEEVRRQIGVALPPHGAELIGRALLSTLAGEPYASVRPSIGVVEPRG